VIVELASRRATVHLARRLAPLLRPGDLLVLGGELGAGKTFFARALLRALGVPRDREVTSPTFTLVHEFSAALRILHADAYRLASRSDVDALGLREARGEGACVVIEWGEPYVEALGGDALVLRLELVHRPNARRAAVSGCGPRGEALARGIMLQIGPS